MPTQKNGWVYFQTFRGRAWLSAKQQNPRLRTKIDKRARYCCCCCCLIIHLIKPIYVVGDVLVALCALCLLEFENICCCCWRLRNADTPDSESYLRGSKSEHPPSGIAPRPCGSASHHPVYQAPGGKHDRLLLLDPARACTLLPRPGVSCPAGWSVCCEVKKSFCIERVKGNRFVWARLVETNKTKTFRNTTTTTDDDISSLSPPSRCPSSSLPSWSGTRGSQWFRFRLRPPR